MNSLYTVVLSGGSGSRLWPVSRQSFPKPFMKLPDGDTLIEKVYKRVKTLGSDLLTVTNRDYYFMSKYEQERVGISGRFLLEPFGRNTAPAVALASKYISSLHGADSLILVLTSDHIISDEKSFASVVKSATNLAASDFLVTFGVIPTYPETGFGYIKKGGPLMSASQVEHFIEKPSLPMAQHFVTSGNYLWNSGMFCFKASTFLEELSLTAPAVAMGVEDCWNAMKPLSGSDTLQIPSDLFRAVPDVSIDCAVMEKSKRVAVVQSDFGWNDIGSWTAVRDFVQADVCNNRAVGDVIFIDTQNTFVQSESRLVATVGISDLMIIDTPDALLVAHPNKAQEVKKVVAQLKNAKHQACEQHRTVSRPWGTYTVLGEGSGFKIKRIEVMPGARISLQMHHHRSEHWVVVNGTAKIINGESEILVQSNESTYIPAGQKHRLENPGQVPCVMIEVQCGLYLEEDDIVRFDDVYGRSNSV